MKTKINWPLILIAIWWIFTVSLTVWWLIFGLRQLDLVQTVLQGQAVDVAEELVRKQKMLVSEGVVLVLSLTIGAAGLTYYVFSQKKSNRKLREFFAAFSHDLKTPIASLRLQAESLLEDLKDIDNKNLPRLVDDTVRLQLQLENSLYLANVNESKMFIESVPLNRIVDSLKLHWPDLKLSIDKDIVIKGDKKALESVFNNLVQNAVLHGKASEIKFVSNNYSDNKIKISIIDNGVGFTGDIQSLGKLFKRHNKTSGSGVGLHIVKKLVKLMNGQVSFNNENNKGLCVNLLFPGELK